MPDSSSLAFFYRLAIHADADRIAELVNAAYRGISGDPGWTHEAEIFSGPRIDAGSLSGLIDADDSVILLCMRGSDLIGSVHLEKIEGGAHLGLLAIRPALQGAGLGRRLLAESERVARERWDSEKISLTVITLRTELIEYYERRGYRRTGQVEPLPGDAEAGRPLSPGLQLAWLEKRIG